MTTLELLEKPVEKLDKPGANLLLMEGALPGGWTPTSVTLPDDLSEAETDGLLLRLLTVGRGHQWWIGDTLNYRNKRFSSQKYTFAMLETGFSKGYLANMASVAKRFETSRRREVLPWAYHADVCGLTDEEQNRWLDECEQQNWSRKELRKQLKAAFSGYDPDAQPLEFASDEEEDASTESVAISATEAGEESAALQTFMRDIPEPLQVDEATMNGLLKSLSGTLIPQGSIATPMQIGQNWWVLLRVHRAGTQDAREDFGLAQRVIRIEEYQGEAFPLATWQARVNAKQQEANDYAGLVVRPNVGQGAWVLVNERMQVRYKSEPAVDDAEAEAANVTEPEQANASAAAHPEYGELDAPAQGGNLVSCILANEQLRVSNWVTGEWHVHDKRGNALIGYLNHTPKGLEVRYFLPPPNSHTSHLGVVNSFADARYLLADNLLNRQRGSLRPLPTTQADAQTQAGASEAEAGEASDGATYLAGIEDDIRRGILPRGNSFGDPSVFAAGLLGGRTQTGRPSAPETDAQGATAASEPPEAQGAWQSADVEVLEAVADMQTALVDVCLDYGDVLAALQLGDYDNEDEDEDAFDAGQPTTVEAFCDYWPAVLRGLLSYARDVNTGCLRVAGDDLALLAKLAQRHQRGAGEPVSTAAYLHDMIAQKAEQAGVSLETDS